MALEILVGVTPEYGALSLEALAAQPRSGWFRIRRGLTVPVCMAHSIGIQTRRRLNVTAVSARQFRNPATSPDAHQK